MVLLDFKCVFLKLGKSAGSTHSPKAGGSGKLSRGPVSCVENH